MPSPENQYGKSVRRGIARSASYFSARAGFGTPEIWEIQAREVLAAVQSYAQRLNPNLDALKQAIEGMLGIRCELKDLALLAHIGDGSVCSISLVTFGMIIYAKQEYESGVMVHLTPIGWACASGPQVWIDMQPWRWPWQKKAPTSGVRRSHQKRLDRVLRRFAEIVAARVTALHRRLPATGEGTA